MNDSFLIFVIGLIFGMLSLINSHASKIDKKMDTMIKVIQVEKTKETK